MKDKGKAIPEKPEELAELLADDARRTEVFASADSTKEFLASYVKATNKAGEVAKLVTEGITQELPKILKGFGVDRPDMTPKDVAKLPRGYNKRAIGAGIDNVFEDHIDYLKATWYKNPERDTDERVRKIRAYSTGTPSDGGFLVPETLRSTLLAVSLESAIVRPRAMIVPMESLTVPFPTVDSPSNAKGQLYGGIATGWTKEGEAFTPSSATFGRMLLECKKLTAYAEVPNELLSDSIVSLEAFLNAKVPEAIAFEEDYAFLNGTGVGEPEGVLLSKAIVAVARNTPAHIKYADVIAMFSRMLPASLGRGVWLASIDSFTDIAQMALNVGLGGSAVWMGNAVGGPPVSILGRPVIFTEKNAALGSRNDLCFIDFGYYLVGDRQLMTQASSQDYKFGNDMTAYRWIERLDGRGWLAQAITPRNGGADLSPFVTLDT
jgi:HK97 family phage major capsid protein